MRRKPFSHCLAAVIRIAAVPPVMAALVVILLASVRKDVFHSAEEIILAVVFLVIVPLLAYPVSMLLPKIRAKGRDRQRALAFWFSGIGYFAAVIYGYLWHKSRGLQFIFLTYFISLLLLSVENKLFRWKVSGHACSVTCPMVMACIYFGTLGIIVGPAFYAVVCWSSVKMKRHTLSEFISGTMTCLVSAGISALITFCDIT